MITGQIRVMRNMFSPTIIEFLTMSNHVVLDINTDIDEPKYRYVITMKRIII